MYKANENIGNLDKIISIRLYTNEVILYLFKCKIWIYFACKSPAIILTDY